MAMLKKNQQNQTLCSLNLEAHEIIELAVAPRSMKKVWINTWFLCDSVGPKC